MNKKGGLTNIQNYIIGIILGCVVFIGGVSWLGAIVGSYGVSSSELTKFNSTMGKLQQVSTINSQLSSSLASGSSSTGLFGWLDFLIGTAWTGLQAIGISLSFVPTAIIGFGASLGLDGGMTALIVAIPVVIIVFGIWMAVLRVNN